MPVYESPTHGDIVFFHMSAMGGSIDALKRDVEKYGPSIVDAVMGKEDDITPVQQALLSGHNDAVDYLLSQGAKVDVRIKKGKSILAYAIGALDAHTPSIDIDMVHIILSYDPDVKTADQMGRTALMEAAAKDQEFLCREILNRGADPTTPDNNGQTAADYATSRQTRLILQDAAGKIAEARKAIAVENATAAMDRGVAAAIKRKGMVLRPGRK